jgi:hypothetical protein
MTEQVQSDSIKTDKSGGSLICEVWGQAGEGSRTFLSTPVHR